MLFYCELCYSSLFFRIVALSAVAAFNLQQCQGLVQVFLTPLGVFAAELPIRSTYFVNSPHGLYLCTPTNIDVTTEHEMKKNMSCYQQYLF